jgi:serine/threonine protein kinase
VANRQFGKYEIKERIGRGGMAEVYKGYHANLDRYVAIKVLHAFLADDEEFSGRFGREAQNIARLKHPHIVSVYDYEFDEASESYYMVMELVNGATLKDRLIDLEEQQTLMSLDEALRITREAASALAYAHKAGMIHRDVKPANLMLDDTENDRVVLTDFGIAKIVTGAQFTMTGGLVGTPAYMSPEQGVGETGDERSDLYSLGVILYQMMTGALPYEAETPLALILRHMNDPIPTVRDKRPQIPALIERIIQTLMAKEPQDRYKSADDLIEDIRRAEELIYQAGVEENTPVQLMSAKAASVQDDTMPSIDSPTIPFNQLRSRKLETLHGQTKAPKPEDASEDTPAGKNRGLWLGIGGIILILLIGGGYVLGASSGVFPAVGFLASETPTATAEPSHTPTLTVTPTEPTATDEPTATTEPSETPEPTHTEIPTDTAVATSEPSETPIPSETTIPTATEVATETTIPSETAIPTETPNATETLIAQRTATIAACRFDYAIIEQVPEDGEDGDFFETDEQYQRTITFFNSGTCPWERNTSLTFLEGEDFNAGPRIFIREEVPVSGEVEVLFDGTLPATGSTEPISGIWQLRTPGQLPIGDPITISVLVFDPGDN